MDKLVRTINGMKKTFFVYKKEEADNDGLLYTEWKDADAGEYALTDDGYVGKCINRKEYTDKQGRCKTFVKLCCGVGWTTRNAKLLYEPNRDFGLYSQVKPDYWVRKEVKTTRFKGITQDMVLELHLEAIDVARKKKDPSNMLRATENLMDLLEMKPGKKVITESMDFSLTSSIADQIESEEKRVKLQQKTEEPLEPKESAA
jgi:hypothetical protein